MLCAILFAQRKKQRENFDADIVIWMDTITEGRFEDTNKIFISPEQIDFHITEWNDHNHSDIAERYLKVFDWKKPTVPDVGKVATLA